MLMQSRLRRKFERRKPERFMQKVGVVFKKKAGAFFSELTDRLRIVWPTM
jgi:hypothetical protein